MRRLSALLTMPVAAFLASCHLFHSSSGPAGIGREVIDGKLAFIVTQLSTSPTFGHTRAQGVYVIVSMAVRNVSQEMAYFKMANQTLKDVAGHEYSASFMDPPVLEEINNIDPGVQMSVKEIFDVPRDVRPTQIVLRESSSSHGVPVDLTHAPAPAPTSPARNALRLPA